MKEDRCADFIRLFYFKAVLLKAVLDKKLESNIKTDRIGSIITYMNRN